jgi:hypothetical protein
MADIATITSCMQEGGSSMDIGSSFTYMFEDDNWIKKIAIGGVVSIIPIANFATLGYLVQLIRNVRAGQPLPLPEWDQFGQYFIDGLWIFVIFLVWSIPIIIVACLQGIAGATLTDNQNQTTAYSIISGCLGCLSFLWALVLGIFYPAILVRFAEVGELMAGFRFGEIFGIISADVGNYIIVVLLIWVASLIASLGLILCVIGIIFTQFWAYLVSGNLMGQLATQRQDIEPAV